MCNNPLTKEPKLSAAVRIVPEWVDYDAKIKEFNYSDLPVFIVDKMCKKSFGHTNWARMANVELKDLIMNPAVVDYDEGIVYFKNERLV